MTNALAVHEGGNGGKEERRGERESEAVGCIVFYLSLLFYFALA